MREHLARRATGLLLAAIVLATALSPSVQSLRSFPDELRLLVGEEQRVEIVGLPLPVGIRTSHDGLLRINNQTASEGWWRVNLSSPLALRPTSQGRLDLDLTLFGLVLKRIAVEVVERAEVVPGGESIGILLRTRGVTVVGHAPVEDADGRTRYPARDAGLRVGDVIIRVDGTEVRSSQHITFLVNRCARDGRPVPVELERGGQGTRINIVPIYSQKERVYQLGLFVRDGAAGVGTLTFVDPVSGTYMALGHVVADSATNRPVEISEGRIVRAAVARVKPGRKGEPGEKEGTFVDNQDVIGTITGNTPFGIVGVVSDYVPGFGSDAAAGTPVPVALAREVVVGPAEILTVVEGYRIERFSVEITRVDAGQVTPGPKGITLKITDPRLIESTGGIVQGMSGSPILQNGRLIGAVTHVFVNDPARGYGVFAEWMLREAGIDPSAVDGSGTPFPEVLSAGSGDRADRIDKW